MRLLCLCAVWMFVPSVAHSQCAPDSFGPTEPQPYFGAGVDVDGDWAIVGALGDGTNPGEFTVFRRVGGSWIWQQDSLPASGIGRFCAIHAAGEEVVAVGGKPTETAPLASMVWTAGRSASGLWLTKSIVSPADDHFGEAAITDGVELLASAPGANGGVGEVRHYHLSFDFQGGLINHTLIGSFSAPGAQPGEDFGASLARDGDVLAVGARFATAAGVAQAGRVYVARWNGSNWALESTLESSTPTNGGRFGTSVAVKNGTLIVGADSEPGSAGTYSGAVHVFEYQGATWTHVQRLVSHSDPNTAAEFGWALALQDDRLFVSAPGFHPSLPPIVPRVDIFRRTGPGMSWFANGTLQMPGLSQFGTSLALSGSRLLVGADSAGTYGEVFHYEYIDCDADGTIDACQIALDPSLDCDSDGVLDSCQIANGTATDCNGDGILDSCQCGALHIVTYPQPVSVTPGMTIHLSAVGCGPPSIAYQWRRNGIALTNGGNVSGANTTDLSITSATYLDAGNYVCDISNPCTQISTNTVSVDVLAGTGLCSIDGWSNSSWSAVGDGFQGPSSPPTRVLALATYDAGLGQGPSLFAGGEFQSSGVNGVLRIARWNGTAWLPVGITAGGANGPVQALEVYDPDGSGPAAPELYAGGNFTQMFGQSAASIARWNGSTWAAVGAGVGGIVECLHVHDPDGSGPAAPVLYVGGGGFAQGNVMRWNGSTWSATGGPVQYVYDLAFFDDGSGETLYAGTSQGLMRYDGFVWSFVGAQNGDVRALAVYDRDGSGPQPPLLYLGGGFTQSTPGSGTTLRIATWNGSAFAPVGAGFDASVESLAVIPEGAGNVLVAGGEFVQTGSLTARRVAKWNGGSWAALGQGLQGPVGPTIAAYALHSFDPDGAGPAIATLHVGGAFLQADAVGASNVARVVPSTSSVCPCGNWGTQGRGCGNAVNPSGALLVATGAPSLAADSVVLVSSGEPTSALSIATQGTNVIAPLPFGDGVRCVGGSLKRLYAKNAVVGVMTVPGTGDPSISQRAAALGDTIPVGATRYYYVYYRDPAPYCTSATFNTSSSVGIVWLQ